MDLTTLTAISPIDGRYRDKTKELSPYFSEYGLIRYRVLVEVEYFISLCELPLPELKAFDTTNFENLRKIYSDFSESDALQIKEIEKATNHDVKAVEYFLRKKFEELGLIKYIEFIHFGLTSQDINNTAIPLSLKGGVQEIIIPQLDIICSRLDDLTKEWSHIPMLARTHGQPATPTRLGKELAVFADRLQKQLFLLKVIHFYGKFGGATGNFNAHHIAYPEINWHEFAHKFLSETLGLKRNRNTTQIDHYDDMAQLFDNIRRANVVLIDFCRDVWAYISMEYFRQKVKENEVGSSAMPHKVNPIDFENAEGNLAIANATLDFLSNKLPISRLQRDLTDSTVLRNIGLPLSHSLIAYKSIMKGLDKLIINENKINQDLQSNWAVVAEAIQTVLRKEGFDNPYEKLKQFTRGKENLDEKVFKDFIDSLEISNELKTRLKEITPFNYTGI